MKLPVVTTVTITEHEGPQAPCGRCNLTAPDDGFRRKKHGGKVFICRRCR